MVEPETQNGVCENSHKVGLELILIQLQCIFQDKDISNVTVVHSCLIVIYPYGTRLLVLEKIHKYILRLNKIDPNLPTKPTRLVVTTLGGMLGHGEVVGGHHLVGDGVIIRTLELHIPSVVLKQQLLGADIERHKPVSGLTGIGPEPFGEGT